MTRSLPQGARGGCTFQLRGFSKSVFFIHRLYTASLLAANTFHVHGPLSRTFTREVTSRPWTTLENIHQGGHVTSIDHSQEHSPRRSRRVHGSFSRTFTMDHSQEHSRGRSRHVHGPLSRTFTREATSCTESRNRKRDWAQYRPGVILNRMEERLGVNGRQLSVRVDRNLEE